MADRTRLDAVRGQVDAGTAAALVRDLNHGLPSYVESERFYPYFHFTADCRVPTLVGKQRVSIACLVDGVNGLGATVDPFLTEERHVNSDHLLQTEITFTDAFSAARRTITHQLGRKLRMIAGFDVDLDALGMVYKRFWIVRSGETLVMVDSATGKLLPIGARAA